MSTRAQLMWALILCIIVFCSLSAIIITTDTGWALFKALFILLIFVVYRIALKLKEVRGDRSV